MNGTRAAPFAEMASRFTLPRRRGPSQLPGLPADAAPGARSFWARTAGAVRAAHERFAQWRRMAEQRRQLARLDERMLKDIGLSRVDAHREARKWFWQP